MPKRKSQFNEKLRQMSIPSSEKD